jgi:hypothetical protein
MILGSAPLLEKKVEKGRLAFTKIGRFLFLTSLRLAPLVQDLFQERRQVCRLP